MRLRKPESIASSEFKSKKWNELTRGKDFTKSDIPTLELLCHWYAVVDRCMEDMTTDGDVEVAYENRRDDIKALPQVSVLKEASAEIRQLTKQLGAHGEETTRKEQTKAKVTPLAIIQGNRNKRSAEATHTA